jgi:hypothetical protein
MNLAPASAHLKPLVYIPGVESPKQPYGAFLADIDVAQDSVKNAILGLYPAPNHRGRHDFSGSIAQARAGIEALLSAQAKSAPELAQQHVSLALATVKEGIDMLTLPFNPVDVHTVQAQFQAAMQHIGTASSHATVFFAL